MEEINIELRIDGGVIESYNIPKGVKVIVRDYDIEGVDPSVLEKDKEGNKHQKITFENED